MNHASTSSLTVTPARAARALLLAVAAETVIVVGHFAHGAHIYDDPSRLHVVHPTIGALILTTALTALAAWRPHKATLLALVAVVAVPFLAAFGLFHGLYSHLLKDIFWLAGASQATLESHFMNPDYAFPDDGVFETGGLLTLAAAGFVADRLTRFVRAAWPAAGPGERPDSGARR